MCVSVSRHCLGIMIVLCCCHDCVFLPEGLSVDHHLRVVRTAAWEVRGTWRPLGEQLGVNEGTLDVSALLCVY